MTQLDLALQVPIVRKRDAKPSHEAAKAVTASGKRHTEHDIVLLWVGVMPGSTSRELAEHTTLLDRYAFARRLPELERVHLVRKGEIRQCRVGQRSAVTWYPA